MFDPGLKPEFGDLLRMIFVRFFRALGNARLSVFLRLNLDLYANNLLPWILNYANLFSVDPSKNSLNIAVQSTSVENLATTKDQKTPQSVIK